MRHQKTEKKNKHILIQFGIFFMVVFLVMTALVILLVQADSVLQVLNNELEVSYEKAFVIADAITDMDSYPFLIDYWKQHRESVKKCIGKDTDEIVVSGEKLVINYGSGNISNITCSDVERMTPKEREDLACYCYLIIYYQIQMMNSFEEDKVSGPFFLGVSDNGDNTVLISAADDKVKVGDVIPIDKFIKISPDRSGFSSPDTIRLSRNVEKDDIGVAYPIVHDGKTVAYVTTGISRVFINELSRSITNTIVVAAIIVSVISGVLLLLSLYFVILRPILNIQTGLKEYIEYFDTDALVNRMKQITVRNEVGSLAGDVGLLAEETRRYFEEKSALVSEKAKLDSEMSLASEIQKSMLPADFPDQDSGKRFELYAIMEPAREVGGDLYDFFFIDDDHLALLIADVSGKGIPAALFMMESRTMIRDKAVSGKSPGSILAEVNRELFKYNSQQLFITTWLMIIDLSTGIALEANAGHEKPVLCRGGGSYELVRNEHATALAALDDITIADNRWQLRSGDKIFVYTDGVTEAADFDYKLFGSKRMLEALNEAAGKNQKEILLHVKSRISEYVGDAPQSDDITMLGFTYFGNNRKTDE